MRSKELSRREFLPLLPVLAFLLSSFRDYSPPGLQTFEAFRKATHEAHNDDELPLPFQQMLEYMHLAEFGHARCLHNGNSVDHLYLGYSHSHIVETDFQPEGVGHDDGEVTMTYESFFLLIRRLYADLGREVVHKFDCKKEEALQNVIQYAGLHVPGKWCIFNADIITQHGAPTGINMERFFEMAADFPENWIPSIGVKKGDDDEMSEAVLIRLKEALSIWKKPLIISLPVELYLKYQKYFQKYILRPNVVLHLWNKPGWGKGLDHWQLEALTETTNPHSTIYDCA